MATALSTENISSTESKGSLSNQEVCFRSIESLAALLGTDLSVGLSTQEAAQRLKLFGTNSIGKRKRPGGLTIFVNQFRSTVVYVLLVAAVVSAVAEEGTQAIGILAAVLINAVVGFLTEYKARVSLDELENLSGPVARVRRAGLECELPTTELVPGDLIILEAGSRIPADIRLITGSISTDESPLTGESVPVFKAAEVNEQPELNLGYQGCLVSQGHCKAVVFATGEHTRLGQLGIKLSEVEASATPMEKALEEMGRQLTIVIILACLIVFVAGVLQHENQWQMMQASIALAVAAIPEGLPVVATLALAIGTQRMVRFGALIRKLSAVETLGCTQIICTDKTGTLTQNCMTVSEIAFDNRLLKVSGVGYKPVGDITENGARIIGATDFVLDKLLSAALLCNDAKLENHEDGCGWHVHGDPTEGALIVVAQKAQVSQADLKQTHPRIQELPFDLSRKRMTTVHQSDAGTIAFVKGAPESLLEVSSYYLTANGEKPLNEQQRRWFEEQNERLAKSGLRVLAIGYRVLDGDYESERDDIEAHMTFVGLTGMADRPKDGVKEAISECHRAGIDIVMLTGDQPATAKSIAVELNICPPDADVLQGDELAELDDNELTNALKSARVIARVKPETKFSIVRHLQSAGYVVAMTGDGVNDAAALRQADIGVAMGMGGTALAREASDMVLTDDNFTTIIRAIQEGRGIYRNIVCAIAYLLTASIASVVTVAAPVMLNQGVPLSPLQLLWLNLIMHVFPALGLVIQKSPDSVMKEPPREESRQLLNREVQVNILFRALIVSAVTFAASQLCGVEGQLQARTVTLATLSLSLLMQSWCWFLDRRDKLDACLVNAPMTINTSIGLLLLISALHVPLLAGILHTTPLSMNHWLVITSLSSVSLVLAILFGPVVSKLSKKFSAARS